MAFRFSRLLLPALLAASPPVQALAETSDEMSVEAPDETSSVSHGTIAKLKDAIAPHYPRNQLTNGREGWVLLNFVVRTDGTVVDPIVEDSSGDAGFERAALKVSEKWLYEPATWNGKPVEQCHTNVRVIFALAERSRGATRNFISRYKKINKLIDEKRIDEADALLLKYFDNGKLNLYETSWVWILRSVIAAARGDSVAQLRAMRKAIVSKGEWIGPKKYRELLTRIFRLEVEAKDYAAALGSFRLLREDPAELPPWIEDVAELITEQIEGPTVLATSGVIEDSYEHEVSDSPHWYYKPMRRDIEFTDIVGSVGRFEIRCDWQRAIDDVVAGKSWSIPESWGDCRIVVFGQPGASFKLLEFPSVPNT